MAFKTAARIGFQKAVAQANPVLLEPMAHLPSPFGELRRLRDGRHLREPRRVEGMEAGTGAAASETTVVAAFHDAVSTLEICLPETLQALPDEERWLIEEADLNRRPQQRLADDYAARRAAGEK